MFLHRWKVPLVKLTDKYPEVEAVKQGDLGLLRELIRTDKSRMNVRTEEGDTPLSESVIYTEHKIFTYLLEQGVEVNEINNLKKKQYSATQRCLYCRNSEALILLIMHGARKQGLDFKKNRRLEGIFDKYLLQKQRFDEFYEAAIQHKADEEYVQAIEIYTKVTDIWLTIGKEFKEPIYQKHCWVQAKKFCKEALYCYEELLPEFLTAEEKTICGHFFGTLSELAFLQNKPEKAKNYYQLAAALLMGEIVNTHIEHEKAISKFWHCVNLKKQRTKIKNNEDTLPLNEQNILTKKYS